MTIQHYITLLGQKFTVKELENLSFFLGIEAVRINHGLWLTQRKYILNLLVWAAMDKVKSYTNKGALSKDTQLKVGGLLYLSYTRLDIAYAVHCVSKFIHSLKVSYWQAVKRIPGISSALFSMVYFFRSHTLMSFKHILIHTRLLI